MDAALLAAALRCQPALGVIAGEGGGNERLSPPSSLLRLSACAASIKPFSFISATAAFQRKAAVFMSVMLQHYAIRKILGNERERERESESSGCSLQLTSSDKLYQEVTF